MGTHQVFKFDTTGNLLLTLGKRGVAGEDESHFNQPTDVAVTADGSINEGSLYVGEVATGMRVQKFQR